MADGISPEQSKRSEAGVFPITRESVDKTLAKIAEDPNKAIREEKIIIARTNPQVAILLSSTAPVLSSIPTLYIEGGLWTYKLIREQTELRGKKVPIISFDIGVGHLKDSSQATDTLGEDIGKHFLRIKKEMEENEPELGRALKEMSKYRSNREDFYEGAMNVYFPIKKALDAQELGKKLGL